MSDYRDRVRQERADLDEKLTKLEQFIATNMNADTLLKLQAAAMRDYVKILDARIAAFPDGPVVQAADLIAAGKTARGEPATVEVTVAAPAGKRARVATAAWGGDPRPEVWTVVGGQSQTWSMPENGLMTVQYGDPHETVAHKRDAS